MKKLFLLMLLTASFGFFSKAQKCTQYEQGQVINSSMKTWFCMQPLMPDWAKMKPDAKAKFVEEYNKKVESGEEKPAYEGSFVTTVKEDLVSEQNSGELVVLATLLNGVEYTGNTFCKNDTMYFLRNTKRITYTVGQNNDTTGYTIWGVQAIPNNLKVGDVLPIYEDYSSTMPANKQWITAIPQIIGYQDVVSTYHQQDGAQNVWKITETKSEAVWGMVTVKVNMESQFVMQTKNYVNANVVREEELNINGKSYKAYVIESQKWTKTGAQNVITSDNKSWQKTYEKTNKKIEKKSNKEIAKMGLTNEQGYAVTFLTEWFVPGVGVVKSQGYDLNGFITLRTNWDGIK